MPSHEEMCLLVDLAVARYPELAESPPGGPGSGAGAPFAAEDHVFRTSVAAGTGLDGLRAALGDLATAPLPERLWGVWILHGYAPDEFAVVLRGHHAHFDGMLLSEIVRGTLGGPAASHADGPPLPGRVARRGTAAELATAVREGISAADGLRRAARLVPRSFPLTGELHYAWGSVELSRLRKIAAAYGVTPNDLYLSTLAGALRTWAGEHGRPLGRQPMRMMVPVTLRRREDAGKRGNAVLGSAVRLPADLDDPVDRLAYVKTRTEKARSSLFNAHAGALERLVPERFGRWLLELDLHPRSTTVLASYVPGPGQRLRLGDRVVTEAVPLILLPAGHALAACLSSYAATAHICFVADRAVGSCDGLVRLWMRELDEVTARAGL
ncbi:WS/DGAT domain-containing protein [Streptomyces halobius]|uniref:diacylglycerol O-acyltransferase n=1 Tax=Streptomyces halobius TaxID=2879846 RepID=A0ABY4ML79_9ACTN|nr:WS/DGAT domain-containing protein [Streptomyces halobius]UQA97180.1 WS/DGAT domain-containing protein [Streptomyces halobius]